MDMDELDKASAWISKMAGVAVLALLLATILVIPLLFSPNLAAWRGIKPVVFEMIVLALVGLSVAQAGLPWSGRCLLASLRTGPNLPALLFLLYGAMSWFRSSSREF